MNNKKRRKYKKIEKSIFELSIKYLEIKHNNKIYKYSLTNYNKNTKNSSYRCSDNHCEGRGNIIINNIQQNNIFTLKKQHTLDY